MKKAMLIYFICSWILGILMFLISICFNEFVDSLIFVFLTGFNAIINLIFIVFQIIMIYVFPENKSEFYKSILMLLINFPFIVIYWFLIVITYWILINI